MTEPDQAIEANMNYRQRVDFGRTAEDYARFRAGFPDSFFDRLVGQFGLDCGRALDLGTGTVARGLARRGFAAVGIDPAPELLREAAALDRAAGVSVDYREARAEALGFADASFDLVLAGQCWHWFHRERAAAEAFRVLRPGGSLVIAHFDWLPLRGNVVEATEQMILAANPAWRGAGSRGIYPRWLTDMGEAGFAGLETCSFDVDQPYSHEAWCGRVRASAGVKASLDGSATERFTFELRTMLADRFSDPLYVPHRVWWVVGRRPS